MHSIIGSNACNIIPLQTGTKKGVESFTYSEVIFNKQRIGKDELQESITKSKTTIGTPNSVPWDKRY